MSNQACAIVFTTHTLKTLVDSTVRLTIDVEPTHAIDVMRMFGKKGTPGAMTLLNPAVAKQQQRDEFIADSAPYGKEANALHRTGFFRNLEVWRAVGTDEAFRAWLRTQPCRKCQAEAPSVAAHVRSVAAGSGTGIKPDYHAIALCDHHHNHVQHDKGICSLTGKSDKYEAREVLNLWAVEAVAAWSKMTIKARLCYEHLNEIPPVDLFAWAERSGIERYLPEEYRA